MMMIGLRWLQVGVGPAGCWVRSVNDLAHLGDETTESKAW